MFEDAADVPKYLSETRPGSTGPYVFADETYLNPGKNLDRYTYEDLLKPVYLRFKPDDIPTGERYDLMYRSMENWKANAETFGFQI